MSVGSTSVGKLERFNKDGICKLAYINKNYVNKQNATFKRWLGEGNLYSYLPSSLKWHEIWLEYEFRVVTYDLKILMRLATNETQTCPRGWLRTYFEHFSKNGN